MDKQERLKKTKKTSKQKPDRSVTTSSRFKRQQDIFDPNNDTQRKVAIVGVGNIGSHTAINVARLGVRDITIWDDDVIEEHNTSSQAYSLEDVGKRKVDAVALDMKRANPDVEVTVKGERYTHIDDDILIIAVDSLKARQEIRDMLLESKRPPKVVIDARIGGDQLEVYIITDIKEWGKTLDGVKPFSDPCGGRYIAYTSVMVSAIITNMVKDILQEKETKKEVLFHFGSYDMVTL